MVGIVGKRDGVDIRNVGVIDADDLGARVQIIDADYTTVRARN